MKWTKFYKPVLIVVSWRKMWIIRVLRWSVLDEIHLIYLAFGVFSVWWKTSASEDVLFGTILPHYPRPIRIHPFVPKPSQS